jgi:uncharacterized membrane protein YedE/YeeE
MESAWLWGLAGGLLIGTASAIHLLFNGRIAGMSGMIRAIVNRDTGEGTLLGMGFLAGAFAAAMALVALWFTPVVEVTTSIPALLVSGVLVGIGVSYASGCTSGHGVSGLSRLSMRSVVATATFMVFTALTVYVLRHVAGVTL